MWTVSQPITGPATDAGHSPTLHIKGPMNKCVTCKADDSASKSTLLFETFFLLKPAESIVLIDIAYLEVK